MQNAGEIVADGSGKENSLALFQLFGIVAVQNPDRTCADRFILQLVDFLAEMILAVLAEIDGLLAAVRPLCKCQEVIDKNG